MPLGKRLDERFPIPITWIDWGKIIMTIASAATVALFWFAWGEVYLGYQIHHSITAQVEGLQSSYSELSPKLDRVIEILKDIETRRLTVIGKVIVSSSDDNGRHMARCIWINELSHASTYLEEGFLERNLRITNLSDPRRFSTTVRLQGSMTDPNEDILGEICEAAAASLRAKLGDIITVKIEPVLE